MPQRISARVQGFTESVIREMTRVVMEHGGVNLAQGMPNWEPPPEVIAAAHAAIDFCFPKTDDVLQVAGERLLRLQA